MPKKRQSIYFGPELQDYVDTHAPRAESITQCINGLADRYQQVIRHHTPALTEGEWCLVFDALNGHHMGPPASQAIPGVALSIIDSMRLDRTDETWGVDAEAFARRVNTMEFAELLALADAAERFWARTGSGEAVDMATQVRAIVGERRVVTPT